MLGAQLADRPALAALQDDERLLLGLPYLRRLMAALPGSDSPAQIP